MKPEELKQFGGRKALKHVGEDAVIGTGSRALLAMTP